MFSDVTAVINYFATANEGFTTTTSGTITANAATVPLTSVAGLTNGSIFVGIMEPGTVREQVFTGTVSTSTASITGVKWTRGTSAGGHAGGSQIVDYTTGTAFNMLRVGILKEHAQNGTHTDIHATSVTTNSLMVDGKDVSQLTPTGIISPFSGSAAPNGWLLCDGSAISRSTYAALFAIVSTTYGAGNGTTTFNLPNAKGRSLFGLDTTQGEFNALGKTGGQKDLQSHSHSVNDPGHNHASNTSGQTLFTGASTNTTTDNRGSGFQQVTWGNTVTSGSGTGISINGAGTGANNLNPYIIVNYIIKT